MSNDLAQADPQNPTTEETSALEAEALASAPSTSIQDTTTQDAVTQPESVDVEALDEAGYRKITEDLDGFLAKQAAATPPENQTPEETNADGTKPSEETQTQQDPDAEVAGLPERVRVGTWSEQERQAIALRARNPDMSLSEAIAKVQGGNPPVEQTQEQTLPEVPDIEAIQARIQELEAQEADCFTNVELDKIPAIRAQIKAAEKESRQAEVAQARQQEVAVHHFNETVESSKSNAVAYYPDVTKPNSVLVQKMVEIDKRLSDMGNPLFHAADKPFKVAQMAANELGIAPIDPSKPSSPKAPATIARAAIHPAQRLTTPIVAGSARTSVASPASINGNLEDQIEQATSMEEILALAAKVARS